MAKYRFVLLTIVSSLVLGCAGSPYQIARMNEEEIKSVSDKNLCFAYDQQNRSHLVVREVARRDIDCVQVLRQENVPVRHIAGTQSGTIQTGGTKIENNTDPSCEGIEITGVGEDMFRGLVPVKYVNIKNASDKRKKVLLDIK